MHKVSGLKEKKIILIGGHELACDCLQYLARHGYRVVLCIVRKDDNGRDGIFPSLARIARRYKIKCIRSLNINSTATLRAVKSANADIVFSLHNNQIFREGWLNLFKEKLGIVNAHHGPLPRYGGFWPEMWAIWRQEKNFGVTLHYVDRSVDSGDIIRQRRVIISDTDTRKTLYKKCTRAAFLIFKGSLKRLLAKKIRGKRQNLAGRSYFKRGLPNDGFVDFRWDAKKIQLFFRAVSFYPFVGPKLRIGDRVISSLDEDLPFYRPVKARAYDY